MRDAFAGFSEYLRGDSKTVGGCAASRETPFHAEHMEQLLQQCAAIGIQRFIRLLDVQKQCLEHNDRLHLARFVNELSSESPVLAYIPQSVALMLGSVLANPSSSDQGAVFFSEAQLHLMRRRAPVLFKMSNTIDYLMGSQHELPPDCVPLVY
jgi:hypothetical protein